MPISIHHLNARTEVQIADDQVFAVFFFFFFLKILMQVSYGLTARIAEELV